jgi:hypothetical protein
LKIFGQRFEDGAEDSLVDPSLKVAVAGLVRWVAFWEVFPGRSCAKYPEDAVQDIARIFGRSSPAIFPARRLGDERLEYLPLLVGEVHALLLR